VEVTTGVRVRVGAWVGTTVRVRVGAGVGGIGVADGATRMVGVGNEVGVDGTTVAVSQAVASAIIPTAAPMITLDLNQFISFSFGMRVI
jgi:hypothetical protein